MSPKLKMLFRNDVSDDEKKIKMIYEVRQRKQMKIFARKINQIFFIG